MATMSRAAVLVAPRQIEMREFPIPEIGPEDGLLRVEACGVCGADWPPYRGDRLKLFSIPLILGHEIAGRIERIGAEASKRWGVKEGDRVVLEESAPCGHCYYCRTGHPDICWEKRYGSRSVNDAPSLWGGYSEYVYLDPDAIVHKMSDSVPVELAPLFIPISNGIFWGQVVGGIGVGSTVVIEGPGQHGLGCVVAAKEAGAGCIIVTGLSDDRDRLAKATQLGADFVIEADVEDVIERVHDITNGDMVDTVVNATAGAPAAVQMAVDLARHGGTVVLAGTSHDPVSQFVSDTVVWKALTIKGARGGRAAREIRAAIRIIESGKYPLETFSTHTFSIEETEQAIKTVGREGEPGALHVSVLGS
jgi:threonine dehydrogenase-like Zn-dependent dehydrogenase